MMSEKERSLWVWGRNYNVPKLIKQRVSCVGVGENHFLFACGRFIDM